VEGWQEQDCEIDEHKGDKEHDCSSSRQLDIDRLLQRMEMGKGRTLSYTPRKAHAHAEGSMERPIEDTAYHMDERFAEEARGIGVEQVGQVGGRQLEPVGRIAALGEAVVEQSEVVVLRIVGHQTRGFQ